MLNSDLIATRTRIADQRKPPIIVTGGGTGGGFGGPELTRSPNNINAHVIWFNINKSTPESRLSIIAVCDKAFAFFGWLWSYLSAKIEDRLNLERPKEEI